jgi:DNA polymerase-3 subunit delta
MPLQKPEEVLKNLQQGQFQPIYFFHGEEAYFIDQLADYIEAHALPAHEQGFNQVVFYGKDLSLGQLVNQARSFPMMAERQVVLVREFQEVGDLRSEEASQILLKYIEAPLPSTILVLSHKHKSLDKRKALYKALEKKAVVVESKKLYDNQVPAWIERYVKEQGFRIGPPAVQLLFESIGNELSRLRKEIDKIAINYPEKGEITPAAIQQYVGISKEYNVFELQKALIEKNVLKANRIIRYFAGNPKDHPIIPMLAILYQLFSRLLMVHQSNDRSEGHLAKLLGVNPYFVKDYLQALRQYSLPKTIQCIEYLRQADLQSKGVDSGSMNEGDILQELVFKILH